MKEVSIASGCVEADVEGAADCDLDDPEGCAASSPWVAGVAAAGASSWLFCWVRMAALESTSAASEWPPGVDEPEVGAALWLWTLGTSADAERASSV